MYAVSGKSLSEESAPVVQTKEEFSALEKEKDVYGEIADIFPALQKYKNEHNQQNLQKLCVEISEFCRSVYASTWNEEERNVYRAMIEKLNSK